MCQQIHEILYSNITVALLMFVATPPYNVYNVVSCFCITLNNVWFIILGSNVPRSLEYCNILLYYKIGIEELGRKFLGIGYYN